MKEKVKTAAKQFSAEAVRKAQLLAYDIGQKDMFLVFGVLFLGYGLWLARRIGAQLRAGAKE